MDYLGSYLAPNSLCLCLLIHSSSALGFLFQLPLLLFQSIPLVPFLLLPFSSELIRLVVSQVLLLASELLLHSFFQPLLVVSGHLPHVS